MAKLPNNNIGYLSHENRDIPLIRSDDYAFGGLVKSIIINEQGSFVVTENLVIKNETDGVVLGGIPMYHAWLSDIYDFVQAAQGEFEFLDDTIENNILCWQIKVTLPVAKEFATEDNPFYVAVLNIGKADDFIYKYAFHDCSGKLLYGMNLNDVEFKDLDSAIFKVPTDRSMEISDNAKRVYAVYSYDHLSSNIQKGNVLGYAKLVITMVLLATVGVLLIASFIWWRSKKR